MTLWEKESKTPSLRPRGVPSLSANHHYHHDHSPHPWWREGPLVGTSGLRLQTQVLKVVDALRCQSSDVQAEREKIILKDVTNIRKKRKFNSHRCVHQLDWLEVIKRSSSVEVGESTLF